MPEGQAILQSKAGGNAAWLRQRGEMRLEPGGPWLPFVAQEWFEGGDIDFRWRAWASMGPLLRLRVVDAFEHGKGALTASIFGVVPVARARGSVVDHGEALRGLAELPWRPFSFRETSRLSWEAPAADQLRGVFDDGKTRAAVEFEIDSEGRVLGGRARRARALGKSFVDTEWSGTFGDYRTFGSLRVPAAAEAVWHLAEGPFPYWRGQVTEFRLL